MIFIRELCDYAHEFLQKAQATGSCMITTVSLPQNCSPESCRFGFEKGGGISKLFIDKGIEYHGESELFRSFLEIGEISFHDDDSLNFFLEELRLIASKSQEILLKSINIKDICDTDGIISKSISPVAFHYDLFLEDLKSEVIGQDDALERLVQSIQIQIKKRYPQKPLNILLAGKSGIGKTRTAELLAPLLTKHSGEKWGYIRVDMNQFNEAHTVSRLIGAPPGYVGYGDPPIFEPLLSNKKQVILFDEMEKAHPAVMKMLMNAMASGRLESSDSKRNEEYNFRNCILIFTTNIPFRVEDGLQEHEITRKCREQLSYGLLQENSMLPEIANRFTKIILYQPLASSKKADILVLSVVKLASQYGLNLKKISPQMIQDLADTIDLDHGVRDVEYRIEEYLGLAFANFSDVQSQKDLILSGNLEHIQIDIA